MNDGNYTPKGEQVDIKELRKKAIYAMIENCEPDVMDAVLGSMIVGVEKLMDDAATNLARAVLGGEIGSARGWKERIFDLKKFLDEDFTLHPLIVERVRARESEKEEGTKKMVREVHDRLTKMGLNLKTLHLNPDGEVEGIQFQRRGDSDEVTEPGTGQDVIAEPKDEPEDKNDPPETDDPAPPDEGNARQGPTPDEVEEPRRRPDNAPAVPTPPAETTDAPPDPSRRVTGSKYAPGKHKFPENHFD